MANMDDLTEGWTFIFLLGGTFAFPHLEFASVARSMRWGTNSATLLSQAISFFCSQTKNNNTTSKATHTHSLTLTLSLTHSLSQASDWRKGWGKNKIHFLRARERGERRVVGAGPGSKDGLAPQNI